MSGSDSLKNKTISGLMWTSFEVIANQGIRLVIQIFLARLLFPDDFGIIGMVTVFIVLSQTVIDSGFNQALIRDKDTTQKEYSTVFYFNLVMSILLYIVLYFFSNTISSFFNEPKLVLILRVLSIGLIINSFGLVQRTMLTKNLDFKSQTQLGLIATAVSGCTAIVFAYLGFGVWSLVVQNLVNQLVQTILLCSTNKWMPSLEFSIDSFKKFFDFGWKLLVSSILTVLYDNIYYLIIGRMFSIAELGYYTNAKKLNDVASNSVTIAVQNVSYPVLTSIQDENDRLRKGYEKIIKNTIFLNFPIMMGLIVAAPSLFMVIFGQKWMLAVPYFQIMCFAGMLYPLNAINLNILKLKGRTDLYLYIGILKKVTGLLAIAVVLLLNLGIMGLLWANVVNAWIAYFINSFYSERLISYSMLEQIKDISPAFMISMLMGLTAYFITWIMPDNNFIILIGQIVIGVLSYIGLAKLFKFEELKLVTELLYSIAGKLKSNISKK